MLLTIIFMIYTVIKTRQEPACKAYIRTTCRKYINHCSILFSPLKSRGNFSYIFVCITNFIMY